MVAGARELPGGRGDDAPADAYVYIADVDDTLAAVTAHGGQVVTPPYPDGTLRVALFADPAGNVLGIWQETSASHGLR